MSHRNAPLTPEGRHRLCLRVDSGRAISHVAAEAGIARQTLGKWHARWEADGFNGLQDRSSRPVTCRNHTDPQVEDLVEYLRRSLKLGPVMLVAELAEFGVAMHASTVHRVLVRRGISRLPDLDVSGENMRRPDQRRYEHPLAGDLVHLDVKKVGRIPDGGGWRLHGRGSIGAKTSARRGRIGYAYLHTAIDDHSRLAYTESLDDEKAVTAAGSWHRAKAFFAAHGIDTIRRVLTDNGSCYRATTFNDALGDGTVHKYTRPYRPQTNGKVERYNRTLAQECLYAHAWTCEQQRTTPFPPSYTATTTIDPTPR